jgi:tryptophan aminotransferase
LLIVSTHPRPANCSTNPIGCNPSGCSAGRERKLAILKICKQYDILIIEGEKLAWMSLNPDDPYYFLTPELIPSYFELEPLVISPPGQVIRFDSFSKILSGGMRLGYATGPTALISAIDVQTSGTNLHTSGVSQILAYSLLKSWGMSGLLSHSKAVAEYYRIRRVWFEEIARKHLADLADWVSPVAGMFLWIDVSKSGIDDTERLIKVEALANGVLAVPGYA